TYCVQRIRSAEIAARKQRRDIRPGEVVTACQQACPTGAIQFGRLDHDQTLNVQWRGEDRHYAGLSQLGTRPHTAYRPKLWNPNPDLPMQLGPASALDSSEILDRSGEDSARGDR